MNALRKEMQGISLVELLVSLAIGVVLIGGSLSVYISGKATYTLNETIARMQENAAFALKFIEEDVRLAGLWGTHNSVATITGRASDNPIGTTPANDCTANWSIDLDNAVEGSNNAAPVWACLGTYQAGTDILTIRRVDPTPVATADLQAGQMYLRSSLTPRGEVFVGTAEPNGFAPNAQNFPLLAHAYYVSPDSLAGDANNAVPALHRVELVDGGGAPSLRDAEIVTGVEQFQVQFGLSQDADDIGGAVVYVDPDNPLLAPGSGAVVVSVRVWVLVRAELPELNFDDNPSYTLGDVVYTVPTEERDHRRLLVTRTFDVRNRI